MRANRKLAATVISARPLPSRYPAGWAPLLVTGRVVAE
jgi:hypothetical protein